MKNILYFLFLIQLVNVNAGPISYAVCQSACAGIAAAAAGGGAWMAMPVVVTAYSACQAACAASLVAPIP